MATDALSHALQVTQDSLAAFQRMQEQTAQLHRQFLETQESAQRTLQVLVEGQQRLLAASLGLPAAAPAVSVPAAVPIALPAPVLPIRGVADSAPATRPPPAPVAPVRVVKPTPRPPTPTPPPAAGLSPDRVQQVLLAVVADKTGYPPDMLDPDMGLDADLGIDSIKRVEILSALQEQLPDAPAIKPEHLGTLHTLRQIVEFLCQGATATEPAAPARVVDSSLASASGSPAPALDRVLPVLLAIVADKTGYPPEMIDPDMGLDADLGIDSIKRVEILSALQEQLPDAPAVKPEHLGTLHTLRQIAEFLCAGEPAAPARENQTTLAGASGSEIALDRRTLCPVPLTADRPAVTLPAGAEVWLVGDAAAVADRLTGRGFRVWTFRWDDVPPSPTAPLGGLVLVAPPAGDGLALRAFRWFRAAGPALRQSAAAVVATVTHLDGAFGLSEAGPRGDAEAGALAGLAKTARHEWPTVAAKAIDLDPALDPAAAADAIVDELVLTGPAEVGIRPDGRCSVELVAAPLASDNPASPFGPTDVVVLTGGARGVTAEAAVAVAGAGRPAVVLLGRSPEPAAEPATLAACADEPALKRALAAQMPGATPRQLDERCKAVLAGR
ncbi:MAG TPA: phosphopantetheine-binding protein, partial [Gemmataceae bacterium]